MQHQRTALIGVFDRPKRTIFLRSCSPFLPYGVLEVRFSRVDVKTAFCYASCGKSSGKE